MGAASGCSRSAGSAVTGKEGLFRMAKAVDIVVYYTHGCPATPKTVELIRQCVSELKIRAALREVPVRTQEEADAWRFLGSPTVHVDGRDIDPAARASKTYGFM